MYTMKYVHQTSIYQSVCLSPYLSTLPICLSTDLSIYLSDCLSTYESIYLSKFYKYLSIFLSFPEKKTGAAETINIQ